jgi:arginine deiminase
MQAHNLTSHAIERLDVHSEIGRLRQVILHTPKREIERMTPANAETLLFDDILFLEEAQQEHSIFAKTLATLGIDVFDAESLLTEALEKGVTREDIFRVVTRQIEIAEEDSNYRWLPEYGTLLRRHLERLEDPKELARVLIEGVLPDKVMANYYHETAPFLLTPIPNLLFTRDPASVVGNRVLISSMAKSARKRENLLMSLIFKLLVPHQKFWFDPYETESQSEDGEQGLVKTEPISQKNG